MPPLALALLVLAVLLSVTVAFVVEVTKAGLDAWMMYRALTVRGAFVLPDPARVVLLRVWSVALGVLGALVATDPAVQIVEPMLHVDWTLQALGGVGIGLASEGVYRWAKTLLPDVLAAIRRAVLRVVGGGGNR